MRQVYLDHAATAPIDPRVLDVVIDIYRQVAGNPESVHAFGRQARKVIDEARHTIAKAIGARSREIVFTSGGTEGDNMALIGVARARRAFGRHIITTAVEHHAVLRSCAYLENCGFAVDYLGVDRDGRISLSELEDKLRGDTILVSVMYGNNEVGTLQPIREIADLLAPHQALFHTDAVQAFGTVDIDVRDTPVDLLSMSAHKIGGPKGIGFLYVKDGVNLAPVVHGGDQERKRRAGTHNVPGIAGLGAAVGFVHDELPARIAACLKLRQQMIDGLARAGTFCRVNGSAVHYLPQILSLYFPDTPADALLARLDLAGVAASAGSACTAGSLEPSHVLQAMFGQDAPETKASLRFSFGPENTADDVEQAGKLVAKVVREIASVREGVRH
ncbi:MAG: cysteine desulfurase family protein [Sporolactobacillus sp.]